MAKTNDGKAGDGATGAASGEGRVLSPAAERALAEAAERRAQLEDAAKATAQSAEASGGKSGELGGRAGPDPVRYGDWENGGIASDF